MSGELREVQEKFNKLSIEHDKLNDEWAAKFAARQDEFQQEKQALLQDSSSRLQAAREDADAKNLAMVSELDKLRRAFTGDPLGWAASTDEHGKAYYFNSETGESDYDKPRILEVAEVVQNMDKLEEGKQLQEKAIKKGKESEMNARKMEVALNETRAEAAVLRKNKKEWEACGAVITSLCMSMMSAMDSIDSRVQKIEIRIPVVQQALATLRAATGKVTVLTKELGVHGAMIARLHSELAAASAEVQRTREKANRLDARFDQAVQERVDEVRLPLEDELAAAYTGRQEERALRESDRRYLADLWPDGWLVPSMLRRFRTVTLDERAERTRLLEEIEAERDLIENVRAGVAAAAKWETKNDDYGRVYYANWETGEAVYEQPPEAAYRPPLGRNELGEKVDPRLQTLREWEKGTDGWGKPYWQNGRSGEVVQEEPSGWSEAMGLGEDELNKWEGPTKAEDAENVAVEAARVVISWLNKAREAEEKRKRAVTEPIALDSDDLSEEEEDDANQEEFVYDIQAVEELAMGDNGWQYQRPEGEAGRTGGGEGDKRQNAGDEEKEAEVAELRSNVAKLARREDRLEGKLTAVRRQLEELAHDLIVTKRTEEERKHSFVIGHGWVEGVVDENANPAPSYAKEVGDETDKPTDAGGIVKTDTNVFHPGVAAESGIAVVEAQGSVTSDRLGDGSLPKETAHPTGASDGTFTKKDYDTIGETADDGAAEAGTSSQIEVTQGKLASSIPETRTNHVEAELLSRSITPKEEERKFDCERAAAGILPDSVVQEIAAHAFPLAEGVSCAAFHCLAAEAVWAGFNGSDRVVKPPGPVWATRGGDRWGTAAFFAERITEREDEAIVSLPQSAAILLESSAGFSTTPLSRSSLTHAAARGVRLAAVSSRRGFLKQAMDMAAEEARRHMRDIADRVMDAAPITETDVEAGTTSVDEVGSRNPTSGRAGIDFIKSSGERVVKVAEKSGDGCDKDPVLRSAVMLTFGAELPRSAATACDRPQQLPFRDDWDDPEVCERQYAEQFARRKKTLQLLVARDRAPLDRPKGYDDTTKLGKDECSHRRGPQDAGDLLRYEAVLLERELHQTLAEVSTIHSNMEAGRSTTAERWATLISAEERVLKRLTTEVPQRQSELAKLSMEIRGLRVPLVEPQPPPPPTLDPGGIKPPALVPDGKKLKPGEVADLVQSIRGGKYDRGEPIILPEGNILSPKHLKEVTAVLQERHAEVVEMLAEEMVRHEEAMGIYEYKHCEWERLEIERKEFLSARCQQSRLDVLHLDNLAASKRSHGEHLALLQEEASADERVAAQSQQAQRRFEATVAKQLAEEARAHDWVLRLQLELSETLAEREALERLSDAGLNRLDLWRWEKKRADGMVECRRRVAELREGLVEEGRRRKLLYEEKRWAAQSELRRVRAEDTAVWEKTGMLRLLLQVGEATLAARELTLNSRKKEAAEDKEGIGTEGSVLPGEVYSKSRAWVSTEFKEAEAELKGWEEKLEEMVKIRTLARQRETTIGELVLGAARGAPPPPHPDQWLPTAEHQRHEDEIRLLLGRQKKELRVEKKAVEDSRVEVREATRDAFILKARLEAIEGWREHEIQVLRTAGRDAVENLKGLLEKQREEADVRIDSLEQALSEVRKEYNEVRAELTARIEALNRGRSNTQAWVKALRHDLAMERAHREAAESRLAAQTDGWKVMSEKLRTELRSERMHALRLELWVATLRDEIRRHKDYQEELRLEREREREQQKRDVQAERHHVWRNRTAIRLLGTSVDGLFLFFAQRLANLAGSRRIHNDALRANGAVEVLAAICRSPRKDLRRLAARALGGLGWDGYIEARVLAWDIYRQWDLWVENCCPAEEERLRRRGRTFEDPEQFRHVDEIDPLPTSPTSHIADGGQLRVQVDGTPVTEEERREGFPHEETQLTTTIVSHESTITRMSTAGQPMTANGGNEEPERGTGSRENATSAMALRSDELEDNGQNLVGQDVVGIPTDHRGEEDTEKEFCPTKAMSAKAVVRARRQWALRRARRSEGPNEANQLELGGGAGVATGGAWTSYGVAERGITDGDGSVVRLLVHLCRDPHDWEVVRAAAGALSVAAYHEANADRMGTAAPQLISVIVGLLSHPDTEIQAHAATTLANLAHGSPKYQGNAGEVGAIKALLNVCRGRAGIELDSPPTRGREGLKAGEGAPRKGNGAEMEELEGNEGGEGEGGRGTKRDGHKEGPEAVATESKRFVAAGASAPLQVDEAKGGEEGGAETMDVDAILAATAALANLLCYSDANSVRLVDAGGIGVLVGLVSSYRPQNLLDFDQAEEIQANAVEALVNATRNHGKESAARIHALGISPLVLMCGSSNLQVKRHAALVLGNVSQTDAHRAAAGQEGAVEALFALCDTNDGVVRANALWALGNLAWDPHNQEHIGRFTPQLLSLISSSWIPVRTNALECLGNALFFNEPNRVRVEKTDGAVLDLLGFCGEEHSPPVQEAALRCLVSLTYTDRILEPLVEAGCIPVLIARVALSEPASVRHAAAMALLNVSVLDRFKAQVASAGCVETAVTLLGSDDQEERDLAARILAALAGTDGDAEEEGKGTKKKMEVPHLLGILKMDGNLTAQKAAAEKLAQEIWKDTRKQLEMGDCGGVEVLLGMCKHDSKTESRLLIPVLWSLRNCLHNSAANKGRLVRDGGLETLAELCHSSRSAGKWEVTERVLATLVTASLGDEKICRRLLRVALDELVDAAEDLSWAETKDSSYFLSGASAPCLAAETATNRSKSQQTIPRATISTDRVTQQHSGNKFTCCRRGPAADVDLGLDQIDEVGVDGVLREGAATLSRSIQGEARETCAALATSLLQILGPFNYIICGHCGAREKGGTTCSQCGYGISYELEAERDEKEACSLLPAPKQIESVGRVRRPVLQGT